MRLWKARVQNYRSVIDSGEFEVEQLKTILVGPNEAGKTAILTAIQLLNPPAGTPALKTLRDLPRHLYDKVKTGEIKPAETRVVTGKFRLDDDDKADIPPEFADCRYCVGKNMDNSVSSWLENAPPAPIYAEIKSSLKRMAIHMDKQHAACEEESDSPKATLESIIGQMPDNQELTGTVASEISKWLDDNFEYVEENSESEEERHAQLLEKLEYSKIRKQVFETLKAKLPVFIFFSNYFRVRPNIHLENLASRTEANNLDDEFFDYGNNCLLSLLGFTARELADLGKDSEPKHDDVEAHEKYREKKDTRRYELNAASMRLSTALNEFWNPREGSSDAASIRMQADAQYLTVGVEDELGAQVELDQRSEGFQWLFSFFVVFFAESDKQHSNAILLLDEPGLSLHALKQRDFRNTLSLLSEQNQTLYSTHSPFLVGPDELDMVRVVELPNRKIGTKVHTTLSSEDPAGLLPLQEALGYDLAHSLFSQSRNLVLEGITDYWYFDATASLLRESGVADFDPKIALVFANSASKLVYYATILHAHNLKVAALLDSDNAGDNAAKQETLVHTLGNKKILRTGDFCGVQKAEIEDLLRDELISIVSEHYSVDVSIESSSQPDRSIVSIFEEMVPDFSKYSLAKAYVRWTRDNSASELSDKTKSQWKEMLKRVGKVLK